MKYYLLQYKWKCRQFYFKVIFKLQEYGLLKEDVLLDEPDES